MVFIKTKMIPPLKFYLKLDGTSRQYQLNINTCHIINFFLKKYFSKRKKKIAGGGGCHIWPIWGWPRPDRGGSATLMYKFNCTRKCTSCVQKSVCASARSNPQGVVFAKNQFFI